MHVLYEDPHLIAVTSRPPLLTQAPAGVPNLEAEVKAYIKAKYAKPAGVYLGVPHRLDRPVTGVVVFARNTKAARRVHQQFHDRTVTKVYWALVAGTPAEPAGVWADWMRKVPDKPEAERADPGVPGAKRAELAFRVLAESGGASLLELTPVTGRMHQLRAQAAWHGHPVLGDAAYGSGRPFGPELGPAAPARDRVVGLHARRLVVAHPFTAAAVELVAPVPGYWPDLPAGL